MVSRPVAVPAGPGARSTRRGRPVAAAARAALADIDSDHAAEALLAAIVVRLAEDIDDATEVRDRVAASRELREVLRELDTAVVPPAGPAQVPGGGGIVDDDDPFDIGTVPPTVGDSPAS